MDNGARKAALDRANQEPVENMGDSMPPAPADPTMIFQALEQIAPMVPPEKQEQFQEALRSLQDCFSPEPSAPVAPEGKTESPTPETM